MREVIMEAGSNRAGADPAGGSLAEAHPRARQAQ